MPTESRRILAAVAVAGYVATIPLANWTLQHFGFWSWPLVGAVPAGVVWAALALTLRDAVHELAGARVMILALVLGAALTLAISPAFAVASAVAFGVSELADAAVWTPLRRDRPALALALSNTVGASIDSALFLALAFGSLHGWLGLTVAKVAVGTLPALAVLVPARRRFLPAEA